MASENYWQNEATKQRLEEPLFRLEPIWKAFALNNNLTLVMNAKGWPNLTIEWGKAIRLLLQLFLCSETEPKYTFWLCASQDRGTKRYWKKETPIQGQGIDEFFDRFPLLLQESRVKLEDWTESDLEFAVDTKPVP